MLKDPAIAAILKTPIPNPNPGTSPLLGAKGKFAPPFKASGLGGVFIPSKPSPSSEYNYGWEIVPTNPGPLPKVPKLTPGEILSLSARGRAVTGAEFFAAAEEMRMGVLSAKDRTTLHTLYDKAAEMYTKEGNFIEAFKARAGAARYAGPDATSPLHNLDQSIDAGSKKQSNQALGAHFSSLDTGILKGGQIRAFNRVIDSTPMTEVQFKISKPARYALQNDLVNIQKNLAEFEQSLPPELKGKVRITEVRDTFLGKDGTGKFTEKDGYTPGSARAIQIEFEGVGAVVIGNSPDFHCLYNSVKVLVESGQKEGVQAARMHQMLTMLGIGPILNEQRVDDDRRILAAQIFRTYYPKKALQMERTKEFYELPLDALIQKIEKDVPEMKAIFKRYRDHPELAVKTEIYKGRSVWALTDISQEMRKKGAHGLMAGVGYGKSTQEAAEVCALMLKGGALASEERFHAGLFAKGASSEVDLGTGGGDHVFTRLINDKTIAYSTSSFSLSHSCPFTIMYDLDAVNQGAYGFDSDQYGCRNPIDVKYGYYSGRDDLITFAGSASNTSNEVMVKNSVSPQHIRGFLCKSQSDKDKLVAELTKQGLIVGGMIHGKPVDQFIHVGSSFKKEMWNK